MKKQHCTRFLCALLSALLLVFPLAGCANQTKKEPRVTCRQSIVPAMQSETLLEFEAQGIRFDPKMTSEVLVPLGSFAGRRVEIVSAEKRKLSLRLYGEIQKDGAAGAYLDNFARGHSPMRRRSCSLRSGLRRPGFIPMRLPYRYLPSRLVFLWYSPDMCLRMKSVWMQCRLRIRS